MFSFVRAILCKTWQAILIFSLLSVLSISANAELIAKNHSGLPVIILKIDDLKNYKLSQLSKDEARWDRFVNYIKNKKLKANIGAIGENFDSNNSVDKLFYADLHGDILATGVIELFNHSFCYCPDSFTSKTAYSDQYRVLNKAQTAVEDAMNITMIGFGSGGNRKSADTVRVMNSHPDMKVWFFGKDQIDGVKLDNSKVLNLTREWRYDDLDEIPSVKVFLSNFEIVKNNPFMVYQGHAGKWSSKQFNMFKNSIDALLAKYPDIKFMTISEYYNYIQGKSGSPAPPNNLSVEIVRGQ